MGITYTNEVDEIEQAIHQINSRLSLEQIKEIKPSMEKLVRAAVAMDTEIAKLNGKIRKREHELDAAKSYVCNVLCTYSDGWDDEAGEPISERCEKCKMRNL
jgi:flavorubredoxin